jgi:hypothetical protein
MRFNPLGVTAMPLVFTLGIGFVESVTPSTTARKHRDFVHLTLWLTGGSSGV